MAALESVRPRLISSSSVASLTPASFNRASFAPLTDPAHLLIGVMIGSPAAIYGSVFYLLTGAFLLHAAAGVAFLAVCLGRAYLGHYTPERHFGFAAAAWFWHFGDVMWLFIYAGLFVAAGGFAGHGAGF